MYYHVFDSVELIANLVLNFEIEIGNLAQGFGNIMQEVNLQFLYICSQFKPLNEHGLGVELFELELAFHLQKLNDQGVALNYVRTPQQIL